MMVTSPRPTDVARLAGALVLVVLLGGARPAHAQAATDETAQAKEAFLTAEAYYRKGDFKEAISYYQRADELKPHPAVLYNIGECFERLAQYGRAVEYYEHYLTELPKAKDHAAVAAKVARFRTLPSRVAVSSSPPGALVLGDGERRGRTPLTIELPPGDHDVEATYRDRGAQHRQIQCAFGHPQFVAFTFGARAGRLVVRATLEGVEVQLDGEVVGYTPFTPANDVYNVPTTHRPPSPVAPPPTAPPKARYTLGAFGGAQALSRPAAGFDQVGVGGVSMGIQAGNRALDLQVDLLFPSPIVADRFLRWYTGQGVFRPFFKLGMVVATRKEGDTSQTATWGTAVYGLSAGAGLALDVGSSMVLFGQVSMNILVDSGTLKHPEGSDYGLTSTGDYRRILEFPILFGAYFKL